MQEVYLYALGSNLCFSIGGQAYTYFSRKISPVWMNFLKAALAGICFLISALLLHQFQIPDKASLIALTLSGALGLGLGDIFLLMGFKQIGPARTMMLFSFQPIVIGILSYVFLDQLIDTEKLWAIIFFMMCVIIISFESFKRSGKWQLSGIIMALLGLILDAVGIIMTRGVFDKSLDLQPITCNFYRALGAIIFFLILNIFKPIDFFKNFYSLNRPDKLLALISPVIGTYMSLGLFLMAVQKGSLASISGVAISGTVFSTLFECILQKRWPTKYFYISFTFFLIGMKILLF